MLTCPVALSDEVAGTDPVIVEPSRPKDKLLLLLNTMLAKLALDVPAEIATGEAAAVPPEITTEPLDIPTLTLPAPLNDKNQRLMCRNLIEYYYQPHRL